MFGYVIMSPKYNFVEKSTCKIDLSDLLELSVWRNSEDLKNHQELARISVTFIVSFPCHSLLIHKE